MEGSVTMAVNVSTRHHAVGADAMWGMFSGMRFGAGLGALMHRLEKSSTSALFLVVEQVTPEKAMAAWSKGGATVIKSSLSKETDAELRDALRGSPVPVGA
jgi:Protein of unknown function (DUF1269)